MNSNYYIIFAIAILILFCCALMIYCYYNFAKSKNCTKKIEINVDIPHVKEYQKQIQEYIDKAIEIDFCNYPSNIKLICKHSLSGGKYIRPIIILSIFNNLIGSNNDFMQCAIDGALAIEYIHCSSLILDDIMDNDVERRGKKCAHILTNNNIAQITSVILFMTAYQKINNSINNIRAKETKIKTDYLFEIYNKFGNSIKKLGDGQLDDIISHDSLAKSRSNKIPTSLRGKNSTLKIIENKTGSLFEICYLYPLLLLKSINVSLQCKKLSVSTFENLGRELGILFQISDDFEDYHQDKERNGVNYVVECGVKSAKEYYDSTCKSFIDNSIANNIFTAEIREIIDYLNERVRVNYDDIIKKSK